MSVGLQCRSLGLQIKSIPKYVYWGEGWSEGTKWRRISYPFWNAIRVHISTPLSVWKYLGSHITVNNMNICVPKSPFVIPTLHHNTCFYQWEPAQQQVNVQPHLCVLRVLIKSAWKWLASSLTQLYCELIFPMLSAGALCYSDKVKLSAFNLD